MAKVQKLKTSSDAVTKRLAEIFDAESAATRADEEQPELESEASEKSTETLLDLDSAHADLLTQLLSRKEWTRSEFEELCADRGLMPDGAIERINEAAFLKYDEAIMEGDDPLEILTQLIDDPQYALTNST